MLTFSAFHVPRDLERGSVVVVEHLQERNRGVADIILLHFRCDVGGDDQLLLAQDGGHEIFGGN